jgi:sulfite exporter TauE/SafE
MTPLPQHLWIGFAGGLLAFAHCLGMCGGFVLHLSREQHPKKVVLNQLLWQSGRIFTYTLLGALAGYAGGFLATLFMNHLLLRNLLTYLAGGVIIVMGLSLLGLLPVRRSAGGSGTFLLASFCGRFFHGSSPGTALSLGIATGFLPCPIILAFLAYALQSRSVATGMAIMAALGAGTMVPLLVLAMVTRFTRLHLRSWGPTAGGLILILLGVTTALRGTAAFHHLLGCPSPVVAAQPAPGGDMPCCTGKAHGNDSGK